MLNLTMTQTTAMLTMVTLQLITAVNRPQHSVTFVFVTIVVSFLWGGTLGISEWGCATRTLEPLAYTRASFSWILLPYTPEFRFSTVYNIQKHFMIVMYQRC